jgi:hypothetical protein
MTRFFNNKNLKPLIYKGKSPDHFWAKKRRFQGRLIAGFNAEMLVDVNAKGNRRQKNHYSSACLNAQASPI